MLAHSTFPSTEEWSFLTNPNGTCIVMKATYCARLGVTSFLSPHDVLTDLAIMYWPLIELENPFMWYLAMKPIIVS